MVGVRRTGLAAASFFARLTMLVLGLTMLSGVGGRARADADARARAEARAHYEAGARLYAAAQYLDAVHEFERAHALSGAKPLLFNIAQAYRLLGPAHCEQALAAYERYLAADPRAENRAEVEERIASMRSCVEARAQPLQQPPQPPAAQPQQPREERDPGVGLTAEAARDGNAPGHTVRTVPPARLDMPQSRTRSRLGPLSLIVGGSVVALGGLTLYALARSEYERAESSCPCPEGKYARWERVTRTSYGLAAAGGASLVSGLAWLGALRTGRYSLGIAPWRVKFTGRF